MLIRVWNLFSYRNGCPRILRGERKLSTYYRSLSLSLVPVASVVCTRLLRVTLFETRFDF